MLCLPMARWHRYYGGRCLRFIVDIVAGVLMKVVSRWLLVMLVSGMDGGGGHSGIHMCGGSCERGWNDVRN